MPITLALHYKNELKCKNVKNQNMTLKVQTLKIKGQYKLNGVLINGK
jgi:hypothetical protein